jgi:apolipoprotein N-acyltransferase
MDTPLKYLLPIIGVYGVSFITLMISGLLAESFMKRERRVLFQVMAVSLLLLPLAFKNIHWTQQKTEGLSVGVVQSNLSIKDKWDETLFWRILKQYRHDVNALLGTSLIILPESAIPLPYRYVSDYLNDLNHKTKHYHSGLVYGIPQPTTIDEYNFYNAAATLGDAKGLYLKQHIVPFGEYIPQIFKSLVDKFDIQDPAIKSGPKQKALITLNHHTMATLLCYELAYGNILRYQLPSAEWIISLSEDGWFGRSLAIYQQLQIAQVLALETGRYHIVANNAGLSSVINHKGDIIKTLPAFKAGILKSSVIPSTGMTPWVYWGDLPVLIFCLLTLLALAVWPKRRYS